MIEIAISLAIIGFALVAIIGVLPRGMNVQKANREETIINQDANMFMNAIRSGALGLDDLTNYVVAITNTVTEYEYKGSTVVAVPYAHYGYTVTNSSTSSQFPLINGSRIVGLLSTPKYVPWFNTASGTSGYYSNHVVAYVRSMSGPASEKFPQASAAMQDLAFSYCMSPEIITYSTNYYDPSWVNFAQPGISASDFAARSNYWMVVNNLQANLHDVRLRFLWPLWSGGKLGPNGQAFRTLVGGSLQETNEPYFLRPNPLVPSGYDLYFFQPRNYINVNAQ
jgi:type II secretory pathway pseudopilin PulG